MVVLTGEQYFVLECIGALNVLECIGALNVKFDDVVVKLFTLSLSFFFQL